MQVVSQGSSRGGLCGVGSGELPGERGRVVEHGAGSSPAWGTSGGQRGSCHPWPHEDPTLSPMDSRSPPDSWGTQDSFPSF